MKLSQSLIAAAICAPMAAHAVIITQTETISQDVPDFEQNAQFDEFDPSLGTLIRVTWTYELTSTGGQLEADNDSPSNANVDVELGVEGFLANVVGAAAVDAAFNPIFGIGSQLIVSDGTTFNLLPTTGDPTDTFNNTGDVDYDVFIGGTSTGDDSQDVGAAVFNTYFNGDNGGKIDVTFDIDAILDIQVVSGVQGAFSAPQAEGIVTLTYEYREEQVPVPGTALLLGLGLVGGAFVRRRVAS